MIARDQPFQFSMISGSIKSEPEAFTVTAAVPVTKNRWVLIIFITPLYRNHKTLRSM